MIGDYVRAIVSRLRLLLGNELYDSIVANIGAISMAVLSLLGVGLVLWVVFRNKEEKFKPYTYEEPEREEEPEYKNDGYCGTYGTSSVTACTGSIIISAKDSNNDIAEDLINDIKQERPY